MEKLNAFLNLLADGEWHNINDIASGLKLDGLKVMMIVEFFSNYEFIKFDKEGQRVRIERDVKEFLKKIV